MFARVAKYVCWLFALVCVASIPFVLSAQVAPAVKGASAGDIAAKWDIFAGYSYPVSYTHLDVYKRQPMTSAGKGCTKPEAGVMATSPATAPEMAPRAVGLPL